MDWPFLLVVVVGGLLFSLGLYLVHLQQQRLQETGGRTRGVVVRHELRLSRVATVTECVVRFTTAEGKVVEAASTNGITSFIPAYSVGDEVTVAYDKANPSDFVIL